MQCVPVDILPFKANKWVAWGALLTNIFFIFFQGWTSFAPWSVTAFLQNYIMVAVFIILSAGWKLYHKTCWVDPKLADLVSYRRDLIGLDSNVSEKKDVQEAK